MAGSNAHDQDVTATASDAAAMAADLDVGARNPPHWQGTLIAAVALIWSLFQLYYASNVPYTITEWTGINFTLNSDMARAIHLAFALFLAATAFPLFKTSPRDNIPWYDWLLAVLSVTVCFYLVAFQNSIAERAGLPIPSDLVISAIGLVVLMIATFRTLGVPLCVVAGVFLVYVFFGDRTFIPEVIQWKGASFGKAMWHFWMQTEGVFGVALDGFFVRPLWCAARESRGGQLFYRGVVFTHGSYARRPGQGGGGLIGDDGTDLGIVDCQYRHHRHVYHSADEAGRVFG